MIKIEEFQRVCKLAKLIEVSNSRTFAFKSFDQTEGVEIIGSKISLFKIITMKDGTKEKVMSDKPQNKDIIAVIGAFENDYPKIDTKEEKAEKKEDFENLPDSQKNDAPTNKRGINEHKTIDEHIIKKETENGTQDGNILNAIPEKRIITPQDIEEWKKLSVFDRILLFQKTNKNIIKTRRGFLLPEFQGRDKKTLTDEHFKMFSYIPANVMKLSANIAFLFEWSAVVESEKYFENEVCVRGYFQVEINGKMYRRPCGGSCIKKGQMDWGDTMQGAISEMEKRGIYDFLHGDVRRGDVNEN